METFTHQILDKIESKYALKQTN